jgi:hypothetical protein
MGIAGAVILTPGRDTMEALVSVPVCTLHVDAVSSGRGHTSWSGRPATFRRRVDLQAEYPTVVDRRASVSDSR